MGNIKTYIVTCNFTRESYEFPWIGNSKYSYYIVEITDISHDQVGMSSINKSLHSSKKLE